MTDNKNVELNEQEMANAIGGISQLPDMEEVERVVKLSAKIVKDTYFKDVSLEDIPNKIEEAAKDTLANIPLFNSSDTTDKT